ncbi:MAG: ATPase, T2SS/T4P/T4SS family [Candidatus Spechtbacterales bacterium]|nr:ATPase, T2SS/T4P/T4SS family [Candidatus Spechtbacterales bacterium]
MTSFEEKLISVLLENGTITDTQAKEVREKSDSSPLSFEEYLVKKFKVESEDIVRAKAKLGEVPAWTYDETKPIPKEILKLIPQEAAEQYHMVPLEKKGKELVVGMVDPTNIKSQQAVRFILLRSDFTPSVVAISEANFKKILSLYSGLKVEVKSALKEIEKSMEEEKKTGAAVPQRAEEMQESPVTKIVAVILKHAIDGNASDIHIEPMREQTKVRFRVDGVLYPSIFLPSTVHNSIVARVKILSNLRLDESRVPQDGRFGTQVNGKQIDFRVSTFPTNTGEKVVMRVLDPSTAVLSFEDLGLIGENRRRMEWALRQPFGMIIVSGPTGSGKTTTLYAALGKVNTDDVNIVSLEDPVEYYIEGVSQSQVKPEIDYTFASGLRSILRQDPDIIMVGEIRDGETARLGVQAALTGHLVFSTVHTNDAMGVIPRLVDLDVEPFLLPSSVTLAIAQRLVGRLCNYCKKEYTATPKVANMIEEELGKLPAESLKDFDIQKPYKLWQSEGCPKCNNKRTKGRIGIYEMLQMTDELKRIILEQEAEALAIEEEAKRQGMISMRQDGVIKALMGVVALEDVLRVVEEQI